MLNYNPELDEHVDEVLADWMLQASVSTMQRQIATYRQRALSMEVRMQDLENQVGRLVRQLATMRAAQAQPQPAEAAPPAEAEENRMVTITIMNRPEVVDLTGSGADDTETDEDAEEFVRRVRQRLE